MTHPLYTLHLITDQVESIKIDLTDKNDKTAEILKTIKQIQKNIIELRNNYNSEKNKLEHEQNSYFDEIIFEFAPDNKFEGGINRVMKGIQLDMKDLNNWISAERRLANKNDEYLHSRITLIDYDCEDIPDSEKIED
jgi:Mg2+ and Co2+ transporter CorA